MISNSRIENYNETVTDTDQSILNRLGRLFWIKDILITGLLLFILSIPAPSIGETQQELNPTSETAGAKIQLEDTKSFSAEKLSSTVLDDGGDAKQSAQENIIPWDKEKSSRLTGRVTYNIDLGLLLWSLIHGNTIEDLTVRIGGQLVRAGDENTLLDERVSYDMRELTVKAAFEKLIKKHDLGYKLEGKEINIYTNRKDLGELVTADKGAGGEKNTIKDESKIIIHTFLDSETVYKLLSVLDKMRLQMDRIVSQVIDERTVVFQGPASIIDNIEKIIVGFKAKEEDELKWIKNVREEEARQLKEARVAREVREEAAREAEARKARESESKMLLNRNKIEKDWARERCEADIKGELPDAPPKAKIFWQSDIKCGYKKEIRLYRAVAATVEKSVNELIEKIYRGVEVKAAEQATPKDSSGTPAESSKNNSANVAQNTSPVVFNFNPTQQPLAKNAPEFPLIVRALTFNGFIIYAENIEHVLAIEDLINNLDNPARLVEIEVMIVEAQKNLLRSLGTKLGGSAYPSVIDQSTTNTSNVSNLFSGSSGQHANVISPLTSGASLGFLYQGSRNLLDSTLSAFARDNLLEQVASPKVVVLDGKIAVIKSTDQQNYRIEGNSLSNPPTSDSYQTVDTGFELNITPSVIVGNPTAQQRDGKSFIELKISAKNSSVNPQTISLLSKNAQTIDSTVIVPVNSTFIIGGLFKTIREEGEAGIPYLKEIPVLGGLFRENKSEDRTRETIFFITPRSHSISLEDSHSLAALTGGKEMNSYMRRKKNEIARDQTDMIDNSKLLTIHNPWQEDE